MKTAIRKLTDIARSALLGRDTGKPAQPTKPIVDLGPGSMPGHFWA